MISLLKYLTKKEVFIYFVLVLVLLGQVFFTIFIPDRIANVVALVDGSFAKIDINIIVEQCLLLFFHVIGLAITIILSNLFSTHIAAKYGMYIRHEMFVKANNIPLQKINELSVSSII
jgi:ABC-type multidrug transport system fused ATPase/permease subunit